MTPQPVLQYGSSLIRSLNLMLIVILTMLASCTTSTTNTHANSGDMVVRSYHDMSEPGTALGSVLSHGELHIQDAWARPAFKGGNSAVYLTLRNNGIQAERLVGATTEMAAVVELHEVSMLDDVMHMRPVIGGVVIPADGHVDLSPGRYHLMVVDLSLDIKDGNYIPLTLHFQHAGEFHMNVSVVQAE